MRFNLLNDLKELEPTETPKTHLTLHHWHPQYVTKPSRALFVEGGLTFIPFEAEPWDYKGKGMSLNLTKNF